MRTTAEKLRVPALALIFLLVAAALAKLGASPDTDGDGYPDQDDRCPRTPAGRAVGSDGCCSAARAFTAAVRSMLDADPSLKAGELWMLKRLNGLSPDADLKRLVDRAVRDLAGHKSARLVDPKAPKTALPADPGRGLIKFMYYVLAPIGVPESRAEAFIRDFLSQPGTGYVLTHQFLVLEWAGETGLAVPESLREKKDGLLERIAAEQASGTQFSDLFAERASILFAFSAVPPETAAGWVETILAAQAADGRWLDTKSTPLTYDGQNATAMHPWGHTTGFAAAAIGFYLQRYGVG